MIPSIPRKYATSLKLQFKLLFSLLFFIFVFPLYAQQDSLWLSPNGTDPTDIRSHVNASIGRIDPLSTGYILQFSGEADLALTKWTSIGAEVPMVYADFPSTVTFEMGDVVLRALVAFNKNSGYSGESVFKGVALGLKFLMDTGNVETGTGFGQNITSPYLAVSLYPAEGILIAPIIQDFLSLEKDEEGRDLHQISLRIKSTATFSQGIWITLTPELILDLKNERENLWALRSSLGKMINKEVGFSADFLSHLAGEKRFNYIAGISLRYLIPSDRK
ncbi:MAG: hypothetical protein ACE5GL_00320 [Calditrichia bacterium]